MNGTTMAVGTGLRIGVLGPLTGARDGVKVRLPRGRAGVLLGVLSLSPGHSVAAGRLAELIWSDEQPERVRGSLQTLAARLRAVIPGAIITAGDGYLLDVEPESVDLVRFRGLVRAASQAGSRVAMAEFLDQALELWRGEPLADLRSPALDREVIPSLVDEYLSAVQQRADLDLGAGRYDRVIIRLRGLTGRYPLREPLWGQLLRGLAAAGRPAEAIQEYHRAREILAAELGVDPSPGLQDLYQQLLHADRHGTAGEGSSDTPPSDRIGHPGAERVPTAPQQLPAGTARFAGRAVSLKLLSELADAAVGDPGDVAISVITGMAGVGKSTLAVHWAHQVAARFPDGQLYVDLRGFGPHCEPAAPAEVIGGFLDALGVPAARIPAGLDARAALFRSVLAGQRVLIVLDNARDAEQVQQLLPGSPGSMAVITSRRPLMSLVTGHGARLIGLDVLTSDAAAELLAAELGAARIAAEPEAVADLVVLCGRLPLALAITAARAAVRPRLPLAAAVAELRDARYRLDALDGGDPATNLGTVLSWSFLRLSGEAAGLFRWLGIHPGPHISLPAAASLAGIGVPATRTALRELTTLNLLTEPHPGRYALHDLVHEYAAGQATGIADPGRQAAIHRMLDHYLHTARTAAARFGPQHYPLEHEPPRDNTVLAPVDSNQHAMEWFAAEHEVLPAVAALAASAGFDDHAWQIPANFARYLYSYGQWYDGAEILNAALTAADRLGDKLAQASVLHVSGLIGLKMSSYTLVNEQFSRALQLYSELGDQAGQARAHGDLSMSFSAQGRYREALAHSERALDFSRAAGDSYLHAVMLHKVGWHAGHLGEHQRALACCRQALRLFQELGNRFLEACAWDSLGYLHHEIDRHADSVDCYQRAIGLFRQLGCRIELAETLTALGDARDAARQPAEAREARQEATTIFNGLHSMA